MCTVCNSCGPLVLGAEDDGQFLIELGPVEVALAGIDFGQDLQAFGAGEIAFLAGGPRRPLGLLQVLALLEHRVGLVQRQAGLQEILLGLFLLLAQLAGQLGGVGPELDDLLPGRQQT